MYILYMNICRLLLSAALMILIVSLGVKLGADEEVIASLGQIGLSAFLITVAAMAGSVLAVTFLRRFVLKLFWSRPSCWRGHSPPIQGGPGRRRR